MAKKKIYLHAESHQLSLFPEQGSANASLQEQAPCSRFESVMREIDVQRNRFISMDEYYDSPEWRAKRRQKLEQVGYRCERCGRSNGLQVHHLNYNSLFDERMEDLEAVCAGCHPLADWEREENSAFATYMHTLYGDTAFYRDPSDHVHEFDEWYERKREEW